MGPEPAVQTHGLPASHLLLVFNVHDEPALPAAFTLRDDRWQARASCLTFPHAAGAMDHDPSIDR